MTEENTRTWVRYKEEFFCPECGKNQFRVYLIEDCIHYRCKCGSWFGFTRLKGEWSEENPVKKIELKMKNKFVLREEE